MNMESEKVKRCCAVCEYLYDTHNCPLFYVYKDYEYNGIFKEKGQYKMLCDEFEVNSKLVEGIQGNMIKVEVPK